MAKHKVMIEWDVRIGAPLEVEAESFEAARGKIVDLLEEGDEETIRTLGVGGLAYVRKRLSPEFLQPDDVNVRWIYEEKG